MNGNQKSPKYEATLQKAIVAWVRQTYPDVLIFAIPNEGLRNPKTAVEMKRRGLTKGVADLCMLKTRDSDMLYDYSHALFIECKKNDSEKLTKEQIEFSSYCKNNDYDYYLANDFIKTQSYIKTYLGG